MKKDKILDRHYKPKMHWKAVNRQNVLNAMEEYASLKSIVSILEFKKKSDLERCELCERYVNIELMYHHGDGYICELCRGVIRAGEYHRV